MMNVSMKYHHFAQTIGGTSLYFVKMVTHPNRYPILKFYYECVNVSSSLGSHSHPSDNVKCKLKIWEGGGFEKESFDVML